VRELENVMQRALILAKDQKITAEEILFDTDAVYSVEEETSWDEDIDDAQSDRVPGIEKLGNELRQQEHQIILDTLISCDGSRKAVAERLGISPRTLRYKLARMRDVGIDVPD
jgi:two-component system response regulator FlrC